MLQQPMQPRPGVPAARSKQPAAGVVSSSCVADSLRLAAGRDSGGGGDMNDDLPPLPQYDYGDYDFDEDRFIETYSAETMRKYAKQAVEAEREACAQIATQKLWAGEVVAKAIRARGNV